MAMKNRKRVCLAYMHLADNQRSISEELIYKPLPTSFGRKGCFGTPLSHLKPPKVRQPNVRGCDCEVVERSIFQFALLSCISIINCD